MAGFQVSIEAANRPVRVRKARLSGACDANPVNGNYCCSSTNKYWNASSSGDPPGISSFGSFPFPGQWLRQIQDGTKDTAGQWSVPTKGYYPGTPFAETIFSGSQKLAVAPGRKMAALPIETLAAARTRYRSPHRRYRLPWECSIRHAVVQYALVVGGWCR